MNMENKSFGKEQRIRKRSDYQSIYKEGARVHSKSFIVLVNPNCRGRTRLGITASKKVGNSVARNRIKRLVREFFRLNRDRLPVSTDIVVIAKKDISLLNYQVVCKELEVMCEKR